MRWDLTNVYKYAGSPSFMADIERIHQMLNDISFSIENDTISQHTVDNSFEIISVAYALHDKLDNYVELSLMINSADKKSKASREELHELRNEIDRITYILASTTSKNTKLLDKKTKKKYAGYLLELKRLSKHPMFLHDAINAMSTSGSKAWKSFYIERFAKIQKQSDLVLGKLQNKIRTGSDNQAKECNRSVIELSKLIAEDAFISLKNIKLEFCNRSKLYGYETALDYMLDEYKISKSLFNVFVHVARQLGAGSVESYATSENHPLLCAYDLDRFSNLLGNMPYNECIKIVKDCFSSHSEVLTAMINETVTEQLIDNEPREGKRAGACLTSVYALNRSYILSNDTGSIRAIISLAHEMGHCFHHKVMFCHPIVETHSPMVINEFISKFFELLVVDYMKEKGILSHSDAEEITLKSNLRTFCHTMVMFDFENNFIDALRKGKLDVAKTKNIMSDALINNYYGIINETLMNPYEWAIKPHFYYTDIAYYNFPYVIGQTLAMILFPKLKAGVLSIDEIGMALSECGRISDFYEFMQILNVSEDDVYTLADNYM